MATTPRNIRLLLVDGKFQASSAEAFSKAISFALAFFLPLLVDEQSFAIISILLITENIFEALISFGIPEFILARQDYIKSIYPLFASQIKYVCLIAPVPIAAAAFKILFSSDINLIDYAISLFGVAYVYTLNYIGITMLRCISLSSYARQRLLWLACRFSVVLLGLISLQSSEYLPASKVAIVFLSLILFGETLFFVLLRQSKILKTLPTELPLGKKKILEIWTRSRNFYFANISGIVAVYVYRIVLPILVQNQHALAKFYFCTTLATSSFFAISILHTVLTPQIYASSSTHKYLRLKRLFYLSLLGSILMSLCILALSHILSTASPDRYGSYIDFSCIAILCGGSLFLAVNDWMRVVFISAGNFRLVSVSAGTNLIISCAFLPLILFFPNIYLVSAITALTPLVYGVIYAKNCLHSLRLYSLGGQHELSID